METYFDECSTFGLRLKNDVEILVKNKNLQISVMVPKKIIPFSEKVVKNKN